MSLPILLIEDNPQNQYLITFLLEKNGYKVHAVADGSEGIDLACRLHPHAILLDIQLPVMNGYTVARALRTFPGLSGVPIIAVTSYAMSGDREKAMSAGCDGYIEKPLDPGSFVEHMRHLIKIAQSGATP